MKKFCAFTPILALVLSYQAQAWTYSCATQTVSHHTVDSFRVGDDESVGNIVWVRYSVDEKSATIPVMNPDGEDQYKSSDGDVQVGVNPLVDEDDGTNTVHIQIKSLGIKGDLACTSGLPF
jgi:hypothetical protein